LPFSISAFGLLRSPIRRRQAQDTGSPVAWMEATPDNSYKMKMALMPVTVTSATAAPETPSAHFTLPVADVVICYACPC